MHSAAEACSDAVHTSQCAFEDLVRFSKAHESTIYLALVVLLARIAAVHTGRTRLRRGSQLGAQLNCVHVIHFFSCYHTVLQCCCRYDQVCNSC
jgi:hypothetical protein